MGEREAPERDEFAVVLDVQVEDMPVLGGEVCGTVAEVDAFEARAVLHDPAETDVGLSCAEGQRVE